ncbi:hypothetical protein GT037_009443 [Alternaria burnsii]|uniref:Uncharacterized protein n=1 Tax=Alternaria burnsii TaxID=1187904 RepID=A0A8H7AZC1_9PLEO|nr:uncharacterized protein GT037_009443 [Alternaria burnsii]KAF7672412.1 hypothetical protein GT037_009443 [Alternaria burnsii]
MPWKTPKSSQPQLQAAQFRKRPYINYIDPYSPHSSFQTSPSPALLPRSQYIHPPQPTATQYLPKAHLCVLPSRNHKGRTLREMPETHFAFLCVMEMWRLICLCLENAHRLMDQGFIIFIWAKPE